MTLDVIGLAGVSMLSDCSARPLYSPKFFFFFFFFAGFDYHIQALTNDSENELNRALSTIFRSGASSSVISLLRGMVPFLRFLVCQNQMLPTVLSIAHYIILSQHRGTLKIK